LSVLDLLGLFFDDFICSCANCDAIFGVLFSSDSMETCAEFVSLNLFRENKLPDSLLNSIE